MGSRVRQLAPAIALVLIAGTAIVWAWRGSSAGFPTAASDGPRATGPAEAGPEAPLTIGLGALERRAAAFDGSGRNLFRFQTVTTAVGPWDPSGREAPTRGGPPPAAPVAAVLLKFIGFVEGRTTGGKVAILTDGRLVHHGREGDVVDGRYRIVRIGEESIDVEPIDGSSRQTIRLSGS